MPERATPPEDEALVASNVRPFWSGTISFGLVTIPVALYAMSRATSSGPSMRMLAPDGTPLRRRYYCPAHDVPLEDEDIVRGHPTEDGELVVVEDEELERLVPEASRDIDLRLFVDRTKISPLFVERSYLLMPDSQSTKAYRLLAHTLEEGALAGIATLVLRGTQHVVGIVAEHGVLRADVLRYLDEVRAPDDVGLPAAGKTAAARVKALRRSIRKHTAKKLPVKDLHDDRAERVQALADEKVESGQGVIDVAETEDRQAEIVDLMEALKKSLGKPAGPAKARPRRAKKRGRRAS